MKASKNIARSILLTVLTLFPAHLFGVVAGVFIARILGPEGKGTFTIFYADEHLFRTVFGFTLTNSIIFFVASKRIAIERLKSIVTLLILGTMVLSFITLFFWLNSKYDHLFIPSYEVSACLIILFFATIFISQVNTAFTAYFQGLRHFKIVNKVLLLNGLYGFLIFLVAYLVNKHGYYKVELIDVIALSVLILVISSIHWFYYYFKTGYVKYVFDFNWKGDLKTFFRFAGLNHLSKIFIFLNHRIILWFIALYLDNWHVGIFSLAIGLAQVLTSFSVVLESYLSSENKVDQAVIFSIFSRVQFTIIFIICVLVTILSPYLVPYIYGVAFTDSVGVLNIVIVGILLAYQSGNFSSLLLAGDQIKYNVVSSSMGILATVITAPFLIEKYSIIGAAYCQLIAYLTVFGFQYVTILIKTNVDRNLFFITRTDVKYVCNQLRKSNSSLED